jgi:hypothetical protein
MGGNMGAKALPDLPTSHRRQCTSKSKQSGERCKRYPIPGGNVCCIHGGKIPAVQAKAKERLAILVDPAIRALRDLLTTSAVKKNPSQALGAAKDVLDRTGHKPTDEIDLTATTATVDLEAIDSLSTEELQLVLPVLRKILGRGES